MLYREKLLAACDFVFYALILFNMTLMIVTCLMNGFVKVKSTMLCKKKTNDFFFVLVSRSNYNMSKAMKKRPH